MPSESSKALNNAKCLYTAKYNMQHVLCLYELQPGAASSDASILYVNQKYYLLRHQGKSMSICERTKEGQKGKR